MNAQALHFGKFVEPYYPSLSHFAAAACGNPMVASLLTSGVFKAHARALPRAGVRRSKLAWRKPSQPSGGPSRRAVPGDSGFNPV
jgi:hypothetical protein